MTGFGDSPAYDVTSFGDGAGDGPRAREQDGGFADGGPVDGEAGDEVMAALAHISGIQEVQAEQLAKLEAGFERLARRLHPLLTRQYEETQARIRALEIRIRNRQERPLINRMADLLASVHRLDSGADIKLHVEETLTDALASHGYVEFGEAGEPYDHGRHEALEGSAGEAGVVSRVLQRGLASYDDVIRKALVEVAPAAPGGGPAADSRPVADSEQEEFPA